MKNNSSYLFHKMVQLLFVGCVFLCLAFSLRAQTTYYFDQNGPTTGFGLTPDETYDWDLSSFVWNTNIIGAGTEANLFQWTDGNNVFFNNAGSGKGYSVRLNQDITVNDMTLASSTLKVVFIADEARKITLASGSVLTPNSGSVGRAFIFSDNIEVVGDMRIGALGASGGSIRIEGSGPEYSGTITIDTNTVNGGFAAYNISDITTRVGENTKIVLDSGSLFTNTNGGVGPIVIGELSGAGGRITPNGASNLIIRQNTNTEWAGEIGVPGGNRFVSVTKEGTGILSLTGDNPHTVTSAITVTGGSLYIKSEIGNLVDTAKLTVDADGNLGGVTTANKLVVLSAATSQLSPGMLNASLEQQVGTMTLAKGLDARNGGVFLFAMNGMNDEEETINSRIVLYGGASLLTATGKTFTIKLLNLGLGEIAPDTAYTLFSTVNMFDNFNTFASQWSLDMTSLPSGFHVGANPFFVVDNGLGGQDIQITFTSVPESSTVVSMLIALAGGMILFYGRSMARRLKGC